MCENLLKSALFYKNKDIKFVCFIYVFIAYLIDLKLPITTTRIKVLKTFLIKTY